MHPIWVEAVLLGTRIQISRTCLSMITPVYSLSRSNAVSSVLSDILPDSVPVALSELWLKPHVRPQIDSSPVAPTSHLLYRHLR